MPMKPELLLVDDDPIAIQALSHMLSGQARMRFARSGAEALRLARASRPDLMLLDAEMPGMSGMQVLLALEADPGLAGLPVMVVTSHREPDMEAAFFDSGAVDFLPKPLVAAQVVARVRAQLRLQRMADVTKRLAPSYLPSQKSCILVVDDDVNAIQMLRVTLAPMVDQIKFATDGAVALQMMLEQAPDLVLLDVQIPGLDGFSVCKAMQDDPVLCHVPVALITRFADPDSEARGLELGATEFIAKPYQPAVLIARIRNLLRIKRDNDAALQALSEHWQRLGDARVSDIVAVASDAILTFDAQGRIALINAAACRMFGVTAEDVLGHDAVKALPGAGAVLALVARPDAQDEAAQRAAMPQRVKLVRADGPECLVEPTVSWLGSGADSITTLLLRDVTDRVHAEQAAALRIEAEAASRAKAMMLSYIAHEIGNPLNAILGFGQLMEMDDTQLLPPGQAKRLTGMMAAGWQLQSLMRDLLDVSRLESGNFAVKLAPLAAAQAADEAIASVAAQAELAGIAIVKQGSGAGLQLLADAGRLQQCLGNLLSNAIKYNRPGGVATLAILANASQVSFEVTDQGKGLSAADRANLFEPFNRLGQAESGVKGTGLGLVVTRLLSGAMGGTLAVDSVVGEGSRFTLSLPRAGA